MKDPRRKQRQDIKARARRRNLDNIQRSFKTREKLTSRLARLAAHMLSLWRSPLPVPARMLGRMKYAFLDGDPNFRVLPFSSYARAQRTAARKRHMKPTVHYRLGATPVFKEQVA